MLEKRLDFSGLDGNGSPIVQALQFQDNHLVKTASLKTAKLHPDLGRYIDCLSPAEGKLYVLVYALGATEYWGANLNADAVFEKVLRNEDPNDGYRSFLKANVYAHHKENNDPHKSFGAILITVYNSKMHRVELLLCLDRAKARELGHQDLIEQLDRGESPPVSMGLRTPYDICSICGQKTAKNEEYCLCIKTMKNRILPDGRRVFMINPFARFFDLSFVLIGADPSAFAVAKVAGLSLLNAQPRRSAHSPEWIAKTASLQTKKADLVKHTPVMEAFQESEPSIPRSTLNSLGGLSLPSVLSGATGLGMILKPHEFQRILLVRMGKPDYADELDRAGACFAPHLGSSSHIDFGVTDLAEQPIELLRSLFAQRTALDPLLSSRFAESPPSKITVHSLSLRSPILDEISRSYGGYRAKVAEKIEEISSAVTLQDPKLLFSLKSDDGLSELYGIPKTAGAAEKTMVLGVLPAMYILSYALNKARGDDRSTVQSIIEDHPVISVSVLKGLMQMLTNRH